MHEASVKVLMTRMAKSLNPDTKPNQFRMWSLFLSSENRREKKEEKCGNALPPYLHVLRQGGKIEEGWRGVCALCVRRKLSNRTDKEARGHTLQTNPSRMRRSNFFNGR